MSADPQQAHARLAQAAMVIGFNELARQARTLGDRAYFRLAAAEAHEQFVARGGDPFLKSPHDVVTTIEVKPVRLIFRESDIEQMRQAVRSGMRGRTARTEPNCEHGQTIRELRRQAHARIQACRREEQKFAFVARTIGPPQVFIEAWTERRTWQAVLDIIDGGKS